MKDFLKNILVCPETNAELSLVVFNSHQETDENNNSFTEVDEGIFISEKQTFYPIIEGVPRMFDGALYLYKDFCKKWNTKLIELGITDDKIIPPSKEFLKFILPTMKRFELEWAKHNLEGKTWDWDLDQRTDILLGYLDITKEQIKGKTFLDAGAGTGQFACAVTKLDCEVVALDINPSVVRSWRLKNQIAGNKASKFHAVQANVMKPPFKAGSFDFVHSSGVLHHTPNTKDAFLKLIDCVKSKGVYGVWLYKDLDYPHLPLIPFVKSKFLSVDVRKLRKYTPKLNPKLLHGLIFIYASYFHLAFKINSLLRKVEHRQTIKERNTSLFDTLAPPYVWQHNPKEVMGWYEEAKFENIKDTSQPIDIKLGYGFNITATKS